MSNERWPLPKTWSWVRSADIAKIAGGGTPRADDERNFSEDGIKWITPADLTGYSDVYIGSGRRDLSEQGLSSSGATLLPKGTVLFSSRAPVGYCAIAANEISTNQGFKSLVLEDEILPEYVRHYLLSAKEYAESLASGTTFLELSGKRMAELRIPLAPVSEQKRIVRKLDTLSARTSTARNHLTAIAKLVKKYKAEVLTLGVQGQLTSDWRSQKNVELRQPEQLAKHVLDVRYGSSAKSSKTGEVPVLRMGNIQSMELDWTDLVYTDRPEEIEKYRLEPGDVLFNRTNSPELVGKTAIFRGGQPAIYAGYLIRIKCAETLLPEYVNCALNSSVGRAYCWRVKSDSVSQSNINAKKLKAFEFIVPSIDEQQEIIARIQSSFDKIGLLAAEAGKALKLTDRLDERILAKAFAGELVPQDPNDEPASVLLDHIREARANAPKTTRPRRTKATAMKKDPKDLLLADSAKWPANGVTSEELVKRVVMPPDNLRDALFELLGGTKPQLEQVFDKAEERMRLKRVAQ